MKKVCRQLYISYLPYDLKGKFEHLKIGKIKDDTVTMLSVFGYRNFLFAYAEGLENQPDPEVLLAEWQDSLLDIPTEKCFRKWLPMTDIFHYNKPRDAAQWSRGIQKTPRGSVVKLVPEKISSYIYYHYQYQEERPGEYDKYGLIGLHNDIIFLYDEDPVQTEAAWYNGELDTLSPHDNWGERMDPHFAVFENAEQPSKQQTPALIDFYQKQ